MIVEVVDLILISYLSADHIISSFPKTKELILDFCHVNHIDYYGAIAIKTKLRAYDLVAICNCRLFQRIYPNIYHN